MHETNITFKHDYDRSFAETYRLFYVRLINYARMKTGDVHVAEDLVHDLFADVYIQRIQADDMESYLFTAIKRRVLNYWRHQAVRLNYINQNPAAPVNHVPHQRAEVKDLMTEVSLKAGQLPPQCRQVFALKKAEYTNREIAAEMNISVKTVEAHYTRVRNFLRKHVRYQDAMVVVLLLKKWM